MRNRALTLLRIQLLSMFGLNKWKHSKDKKEKNRMLLLGFAYLIIIPMFFLYSIGLCFGYAALGMASITPIIMMMITSIVVLFTTILKANAVLFGFRDFDMILSLPVRVSEVITSRFLSMYLLNLLFSVVTMLPSIIVYSIYEKTNILTFVILFISFFLIPLIPMVLATVIGAIIMMISSRFKKQNAIKIILNLILFLGLMIGSFSLSYNQVDTDMLRDIGKLVLDKVYQIYPVTRLVNGALNEHNLVSFFIFVLISVGLFLFMVAFIGRKYIAINTSLMTHRTKSNYKLEEGKRSTPFTALFWKELRRYFSSANYVMNTLAGPLMMLIAAIALLIVKPEQLLVSMGIPAVTKEFTKLIAFGTAIMITMMSTTASSISLEGNHLWILTSLPVKGRTIYLSKIAVNMVVYLPVSIISSILFTISLKPSFVDGILLFLVPIVYTLYVSVSGLWMNLKFPNFEWTNEVTVIKQSASTMFNMLLGFIVAIIPTVLLFVFKDYALLVACFSLLSILGITVTLYLGLSKIELTQLKE